MQIYYYIFIISFILCALDFMRDKIFKKFIYILFCIFLILIAGLREIGIDNDSLTYQRMFEFYSQSSYKDIILGGYGYVETGYVLLNKIIYQLRGNFNALLLIMAILIGFINYTFFYKKSFFPFITLLAYISYFYLYRDFTQIRYGLSGAVVFWCVYYFGQRHYWKSMILLIFAVLFHNAALILVLALPFVTIVKRRIFYFLLPIPCFFLGILYNFFPLLLASSLSNEHMAIYLHEEGGGSLSISIIGFLIIWLYFIFNRNTHNFINNDVNNIYFRIVALGVSLNFLFIQSAIFQRFSLLLFQFSILLLPLIVKRFNEIEKNKNNVLILYLVFALFFLFYGIRMVDDGFIRYYKLNF